MREVASQFANADKVLKDIDDGQIFDDILIEYEEVVESAFKSNGYKISDVKKAKIQPAPDDCEKVVTELKEYYCQLVQVVQRRYDEVKVILETFYRQQIALKRQELDEKHMTDEFNDEDFQQEASTFAFIADQHNDKLVRLREGIEHFSRVIDNSFDLHVNWINSLYDKSSINNVYQLKNY